MIAAGYEDGNDAASLRGDPMFKMALDLVPSDRDLCSQSTISRLENLPDVRSLLRMGRAMVDLYCASFHQVPKRIVLDIDDTFDAVHGDQQLRLFNAHYDEYGFQPIVVFDGEGRFITCVLRPAKRPGGKEIKPFLRRLLRAIRSHWPRTEILLRGDSHYCGPEVLDWCRANGVDYILGVAPTTTLRRHILDLEASTKALRRRPKGGKGASLQIFLRWCCELEPRRADHCARRGWCRGAGHALHRHQSDEPQSPRSLRRCLLPPRPGRKPHQVVEDASGRRPHLLHEGDGEPVSPVSARGRLLVDVGAARLNAETLDLARRTVRHAALAAHQDRGPRRRDENDDQDSSSDIVSSAGDHAARALAHPTPAHLTGGAQCPAKLRACPVNLQTLPRATFGSKPEMMKCVARKSKPENIRQKSLPAAKKAQSAA
jgi:hypothetical protein